MTMFYTRSFHNSTNESGQQLLRFERKAADQETRIAEFFVRNAHRDFTPSEVWAILFDGTAPITSVRRAMTNLHQRGIIFKTDEQRDGPYGRPEHVHRLPAPHQRMAA